MKKIVYKKINFGLAILIILAVAAGTAWAISVKAAGFISFGGRIIKVTPVCLPAPCGCGPCGCGSWTEVIFIPFGGDTNFICPPLGFPYIGPPAVAGFQILGWGINEHLPIQIGTSP